MGMLFAKLWNYFASEEHKVIIVGLDNAGKTTILYQFLMSEVVHTSPTIGSNVEEVVHKGIHFIMWDIGGQESLRSAWNTYYANAEVRCNYSANKYLNYEEKICIIVRDECFIVRFSLSFWLSTVQIENGCR